MDVDVADPEPNQAMPVNKIEHFLVRGDDGLRKQLQGTQNETSLRQIAQRELAKYERMHHNLGCVE